MLLLVMALSVIVPETYHSQINRLPTSPRVAALFQIPLSPNYSAQISTVVSGVFSLLSTTTTGTILTGTANQRIYITYAKCVATGAVDVAVALSDTVGVKAYLSCVESKLAGETIYFNPPLRMGSGSAVGVTAQTAGAGPFITVGGYKAIN